MEKKYLSDKHPLPVLIFMTLLVYVGLYCRFLFGDAVFMYNDIGSDSLSSSFPILMMLSRLYEEGALGSYSLTNGLGGSTALYAIQYLNPLKFLFLPFGEAWFPVVLLVHQFLLHLLTALAGYGLFSRLFKDRTAGVITAIIWAYSGYMVGWGQNYSFGVCILFFTLTMWILQIFLDRPTRPRFFFLVLIFALYILLNYYFFYMSGIFIAFYVLAETLLRGRIVENENRARRVNAFLMLVRREFAVLTAAFCAVFLAAAPLTQILNRFLGSSRTNDMTGIELQDLLTHYDLRTILSIATRFFSPNLLGAGSNYGGTVDYYNIAFLFTSILLVFALIYLLTLPKTILPVLLFIAVSGTMLFFPAAGYLLTFNVSAQRYAFLIAFMAVLLIDAFLHSVLREDRQKRFIFASAAGVVVTFLILAGLYVLCKRLGMQCSLLYFGVAGGSALIFSLIFLLLGQAQRRRFLALAVLLAVCIEVVASEWGTFYDRSFLTVRDYYSAHFNDPTRAAVERVKSGDDSLYRITTTDLFTYANEGMADGFNATTAYSSELAASMASLSRTAGIKQYSDNFFLNSYDDYYLLTLLAGKYLITDEPSPHSFAYDSAAYRKVYVSDHAAVFENVNTLPFGYVYKTRLDNQAFEELNAFDRQRSLTQGFLLTNGNVNSVSTKAADYVPPAETADLTQHISSSSGLTLTATEDGRLRATATDADPFLVFDISDYYSGGPDALQYFSFSIDPDTLGDRENFETFVTSAIKPNDLIETLFFVGDETSSAALLLPDGALTLRLDLTAGSDVIFNDITLSQIDDPAEDFAALADSGVANISFKGNTYTATVANATEESLLCVPFLYERGWQAWVNGNQVETVNVNGGLIGIPLTEGNCGVELTYTPPFLLIGALVSILTLIILLITCFIPEKKKPHPAPTH